MGAPFLKAAQIAIKAASGVSATVSATLTREAGTYNPSTGYSTTDPTEYTWTGVLWEYDEALVGAGVVQTGDRRFLGAASDIAVVPSPDTDTLTIDGIEWTIVRVKTDPATATYELQVRR